VSADSVLQLPEESPEPQGDSLPIQTAQQENEGGEAVGNRIPIHLKESLGLQVGDRIRWEGEPVTTVEPDGTTRITLQPGAEGVVLSLHDGHPQAILDGIQKGSPAWALVFFACGVFRTVDETMFWNRIKTKPTDYC